MLCGGCLAASSVGGRGPAGDALAMADKLAAGQAAAIQVDGQAFDMQPGFVDIKKETKKMSGR
jgi:hypothetical protein